MTGTKKDLRLLGICVLLLLGTAALYWPVSHFELIGYDDPEYITWNLDIHQGLSWQALKWAFTTGYAGNWHPLTWVSYMLDYQLFGGTPGAMHVTNVAFHIASSLLLLLLFRRITGALWPSALLALLFAWHPLHVESVAWVCERKDVLSTFFGLLALWAYASYVKAQGRMQNAKSGGQQAESRKQKAESRVQQPVSRLTLHATCFYLLSLLLFACGLMSKPMLVTLPFVLLLLDVWPLGRLELPSEDESVRGSWFKAQGPKLLRLVVEKLPFLALTVADSIVTFLAQKAGGAIVSAGTLPLARRLANALMAYHHYLRDAFWPANLSICYPAAGRWPAWQPLFGAALLICLTALVLRQRQRAYLAVGWLWFLGTLVPVIGLVQTGAQTIADRFVYFPSIGLTICFAWGIFDLLRRWPARKPFFICGSVVLLALCALTTRRQVSFWKDDLTVFARALAVTQNNFVAHNLYALALQKHGRNDEAFEQFNEALRINPRYDATYVNLAVYVGNQGDLQSARNYAATALQIRPDNPEAHDTFGVALLLQGATAEAESHFARAVELRPHFPEGRMHWAVALRRLGRLDEAIAQLQQALRYQPDSAEIQQHLRSTLAEKLKAEPGRVP